MSHGGGGKVGWWHVRALWILLWTLLWILCRILLGFSSGSCWVLLLTMLWILWWILSLLAPMHPVSQSPLPPPHLHSVRLVVCDQLLLHPLLIPSSSRPPLLVVYHSCRLLDAG